MTGRAALERALLSAHDHGDGAALLALYTEVGDWAEARGDLDEACFFLTQALVYALETGADAAAALNRRLADHGRDVRLSF